MQVFLAAVLIVGGVAQAQSVWTKLSPSNVPPARYGHGMAFDIRRGVAVMFGGLDYTKGGFNDTWEWDGVDWRLRSPATKPRERWFFEMAYDLRRGVTVLHGGQDLGDTWEWDGTDWKQRRVGTSPGLRCCFAMAYDVARGRTVLFGGVNGRTFYGDTWLWDGVSWQRASPSNSPTARAACSMAYDFTRQVCVMFGGTTLRSTDNNEVWEWNGKDWMQRTPAKSPPVRNGGGFLAYDAARQRTVLFGGGRGWGGVTKLSDTWEWDGSGWVEDKRNPHPPPRYVQGMAYDWQRRRTVLFGGVDTRDRAVAETWIYGAPNPARWSPYGSGCRGTGGVPSLQRTASGPWIGQPLKLRLASLPATGAAALFLGSSRTKWGNLTLPLKLDSLGMTGCTLLTGLEAMFPAPIVNRRVDLSLAIPNAPALIGVQFFGQGLVLDQAANAFGATLSNGAAATIGQL